MSFVMFKHATITSIDMLFKNTLVALITIDIFHVINIDDFC
jgi:hypothetical protein